MMRIFFDESTLDQTQSASRSITGVVYFDFSGFFFPGERWSDFVVVVTTWWLSAIQRLERGVEQEVVLRFMDGPYWITATLMDGDVVLLRCTEDRRGAGVVHEEQTSLLELSRSVRRLAKSVASACSRSRVESSDVDTLHTFLPD